MHVRDLFSLQGQVAVLTGGTERLGYYSAEALAEAGATVILTSRSPERAEEAARKIAANTGGSVKGIGLDLMNEAAIEKAFGEILATEGRLDVLINNASGRGTGPDNDFAYHHPEKQPLSEWEYTLRHNVLSSFLCIKYALAPMKAAQRGSIINLSSISAVVGRDRSVYDENPDMVPNTADYSAAKAAIIGMTLDLAAQVGRDGIRINALLPGSFRRDAHPPDFVAKFASHTMLGRLGEFDSDLKGAIVFLAAEASRYMTGQTLTIDGGFLNFR